MTFLVFSRYQFLLAFFLVISPSVLLSQYRYGNHLPINSVTALNSKKGVLYSGIDNYIKVKKEIVEKFDTIIFQSTNGKVFSDSGDVFVIIPSRPGKVRLSLTGMKRNDSINIGYTVFVIENVPEPRLMLNNIPIPTPCSIPKNVMLNCDSLGIYFNDDIAGSDKWMVISKFVLGYNYGGYYIAHVNPSHILTEETKQIINKVSPDREISILLTTQSGGTIFKKLPIYRITVY